ncbi:unnamed protein product [Parnassius apollo]|uniref:(apollo) hypothetical protein n=1 Tax=Parnassius apollo TaxID=110799 RepID=A0A8S3X246_PARAO|nr:unnamed protein product [Parnassius apollo]
MEKPVCTDRLLRPDNDKEKNDEFRIKCLGAKERSRQRSGSTRSVPVAANIKREVNFDCPEEFGYYPHPTDCTLYYVCVFGGALMESCTGGLMYSHELQTCDWPRNVGCDATGTFVGEELERLNERNPPPPPPPPPPRRTTQPHSARAHPNPVITSRGQPKFNRQEYEQQQQLFAEVDDLPPVEELENDRQQRVYRGQPSTIGQVQKDRDGYIAQSITSGRTINSNIIPASIPQTSSKFSSFSYGTQVDERRTATITPAPQTYRADNHNVTDFSKDRDFDIKINHINPYDRIDKEKIRSKRDLDTLTNLTSVDKTIDKTDSDDINGYVDFDNETILDGGYGSEKVETDRDKRQVTYLLKSGKNWQNSRPVKFVDLQQFPQYKSKLQNNRYENTFNKDNFTPVSRKPYSLDNLLLSTANPFLSYETEGSQSQRPFKPSLPDPLNRKFTHSSLNTPSQIFINSSPISSINNKENLISSLSGGFYNNGPKDSQQLSAYTHSSSNRPKTHSVIDSSQISSMIVTNKPIQLSSFSQSGYDHNLNHKQMKQNPQHTKDEQMNIRNNQKYSQDHSSKHEYYDDSYESNENDEISDEDNNQYFKHNFPNPPYAFTHPNNKYADIDNPFAKPNFDFDAFLTNLRNDQYSTLEITSTQSNFHTSTYKTPIEITSSSYKTPVRQSTMLNYKGVSTPRPFTLSNILTTTESFIPNNLFTTNKQTQKYQPFAIKPVFTEYHQKAYLNENHFNKNTPMNKEILNNILPKLKPPNFTDERQLPITYSFSRPIETTRISNLNVSKYPSNFPVTQKPYILVTSTGTPFVISTPNQHLKNTHFVSSIKPFTISAADPTRPEVYNISFEQSVPKFLTTVANDQLSTLQNYWRNITNGKPIIPQSTFRPSAESNTPQFDNFFTQAIKSSTQMPYKTNNEHSNTPKGLSLTTTNAPLNRKPIPKPSPEMNDYYYDDEDDNYYYEPVVKPKYMPSSEVRPQRPPMAQNYHEYEDNNANIDEQSLKFKQTSPNLKRPNKPVTQNQNDISSFMVKIPLKESNKNLGGKITLLPSSSQNLNTMKHTEISNYKVNHNLVQNRTTNVRKPIHSESGPHTVRPPKYLNQTTLRPYTVRHRLAKPIVTEGFEIVENKQTKGRVRHPNIVAEMLTTPRDNYNQETRYTKSKHDGKSNSLEPTERVTPSSFSPSPRPKMLYNGSQNYSPDQFDPFYAVYDEDGELYKDTDYVQQYNTASLRPVIQQTYRGTPPPTRRPVESYTPKPVVSDDYDDVLIQEQINNPNQYQTPVRHSPRGEGNELGYEHNPNNVRTTVYEATSFRTSPSTTSTTTTTTTTTQRSTTALFTEAMTPSRFTSRPSSTRGRGSAHYSTSGGSEAPQQQQQSNRGTPPTRSRPTLKPSTAIVSENTKFVDIYANPPRRPDPVYPQPTPDKTAAKCRKDVCLLPDCYCGGKDIPGNLPVSEVPQMVLITFDDAVNDLNKMYYEELFESGRVNPNGCPISSTFYVSHEWTDYSQVQNLYADGHEFASHTISATFYVSHEWTDYSQVQNLYAAGHEMASHTISHSFGEQFSQKKWNREVGGQREILAAYGGVKLEDVRGMRAPFLSVGGNKMFKMLYDSNFTYDSSLPVYENRPPSWPYTLDYKLFHDCMIPPCPTKSYPGVWEVPMVMWQDLNGGRCSMGDACANPPEAEGVYKMLLKNFDRHYTTNRAPFGLFYHAAWFTQPHHKEGFIMFLDYINKMKDVWIVTNWQALQWVRDPTPISRLNNFQPFQCNYQDRPKKCNNPKVCNLWHKSGVRYMRTCQPCPEIYPWTGKTGIKSSRIDNEIEE